MQQPLWFPTSYGILLLKMTVVKMALEDYNITFNAEHEILMFSESKEIKASFRRKRNQYKELNEKKLKIDV